jgi:hypothetical protein
MKRQGSALIFIGLFAAAIMLPCPAISAQGNSNAQTGPSGVVLSNNQPLSKKAEKRFVHVTKRYKLTAEQQRQLQSILWKEQQDTQTVKADTLMSSRRKRRELANLYEASQQKIGSILNEKQKRKFDADEKTRAWMDGRLPKPNPGPPLGPN